MFRLANRSVLNVYFGHGAFLCAYVGAYFYGPFVGFLYRLALKNGGREAAGERVSGAHSVGQDRKSTRLNSSHANISYAVFCLKTTDTSRPRIPPCSEKHQSQLQSRKYH